MDYSKIAKVTIAALFVLSIPILGFGLLAYTLGDGFLFGCLAGVIVVVAVVLYILAGLALSYIFEQL
jgi:hypothetical protein